MLLEETLFTVNRTKFLWNGWQESIYIKFTSREWGSGSKLAKDNLTNFHSPELKTETLIQQYIFTVFDRGMFGVLVLSNIKVVFRD